MPKYTKAWLERAIVEYRQLSNDNEAFMERWDITGDDFQRAFEHQGYLERCITRYQRMLDNLIEKSVE
jgi:hypothetical protein